MLLERRAKAFQHIAGRDLPVASETEIAIVIKSIIDSNK